MGLTLLLVIIYIFVGIKVIVACSAHNHKQATKIVSKEMPQTRVKIFHYKTPRPFLSTKKLQKMHLCP